MMTMSETVAAELNGDSKMVLKDDAYGLLDNTDVMIHMMEAIGNTINKQDMNSVP